MGPTSKGREGEDRKEGEGRGGRGKGWEGEEEGRGGYERGGEGKRTPERSPAPNLQIATTPLVPFGCFNVFLPPLRRLCFHRR